MSTAPPRPLHVLVVDDHGDSAVALSRLLRHAGYDVSEARTVGEAFRLGLAKRVDVLVSDLDLTDGDGCELLRRLRAAYPLRGIAVSGYQGAPHEEQCREAGYERLLAKPLVFDQVLEAIHAAPSTGDVPPAVKPPARHATS